MAGLAQMMGMGGGMPSPEEMAEARREDAGRRCRRECRRLPPHDAGRAAEIFPDLPGLGKFPGLPAAGGSRKLPGLPGGSARISARRNERQISQLVRNANQSKKGTCNVPS